MTDRQAEYIHIKDVLLDAEEDDHPISIALRANNATTIRGLNRLAGSPAEQTVGRGWRSRHTERPL